MSTHPMTPTPYPEINPLICALQAAVQATLGEHFIAMYLEGSLSSGDFDQDSDIDFVVVVDAEVTQEQFQALRAMHERIAALDTPWAIQLEGSYLSLQAIRRHDPAHTRFPNIERGPGERLKWADHGEPWVIHRAILRERGIPLAGPPPQALIDPVDPSELRRAMLPALNGWASELLAHPERFPQRGYQSYIVLTLCRILYTLQFGAVTSKRKAAGWVTHSPGFPWVELVTRAWEGRHHPEQPASPGDIQGTLALIRYTIEIAQSTPI